MKMNKVCHSSILAFSLFLMTACSGEPKAEGNASMVVQEERTESASPASTTGIQEIKGFDQPSSFLQNRVNLMLQNYLTLKETLVESSAEGAGKAATDLLANFQEVKETNVPEEQKSFYNERIEKMEQSVRFLSENEDLSKQRDHFAVITESMYELAKAFEANDVTIYYQYCPMAFDNSGGYWLSDSKEILNPYFGEKMLKCGRIEESIPPQIKGVE